MKRTTGKPWTESDVFKLLAQLFPAPAYTLLPQVRNGTGFSKKARTADAVAASTWPSRGLYLIGFEIKVSLGDWRRELAAADKSVDIQKYCRYWYVAAPEGVIPEAEIPPTWGLITCSQSRARIAKQAPELTPEPPDLLFVCSVLRQASQCCVPLDDVQRRIDEQLAAVREAKERDRDFATRQLRETVEAFKQATGLDLSSVPSWAVGDLARRVKFVETHGADRIWDMLTTLHNSALRISREAASAMEHIKPTTVAEGEQP